MTTSTDHLVRAFIEIHPDDVARIVETLPVDEASALLESFESEVAANLVERLAPQSAAAILRPLPPKQVAEDLLAVNPRAGSSILHHFDENERGAVLASMPEEEARVLNVLLEYSDETAGGMMEPRVASLPIDVTVEQAVRSLRRTARHVLYYLYVTRRDGTLVGVLSMRDLLLTAPESPIEPLVNREILTVPAELDREEVVNLMRERGFLALPVVDHEGRLMGVIKHDEVLEAGQLEAFEDLQKIVGAGGDERALSPISTVVMRRLPWLFVNLATAFFAATVIGMFESVIAQVTALAVLLPVVAGQGGNTGSQSLAIVMRGLALREIVPGAFGKVLLKEGLAAGVNALAIGLVTAGSVYVWSKNIYMALVILVAMFITMVIAALAGASIPLLLRKFGRDPAQSAGIFLTTVTDVVGFGVFLGCAMVVVKSL